MTSMSVWGRSRTALSMAALLALAACGGGDGGDSKSTGSESVVLQGQVQDEPIAGAQVCLYVDGNLARTSAGADICSDETDAQGNYTLAIPRGLPPGFLTLVATKASEKIKLVSTLGTLGQVLTAADAGGRVTAERLPEIRVTHRGLTSEVQHLF